MKTEMKIKKLSRKIGSILFEIEIKDHSVLMDVLKRQELNARILIFISDYFESLNKIESVTFEFCGNVISVIDVNGQKWSIYPPIEKQ